MPESPEVRCMRDELSKKIKGKTLSSITIVRGPYLGSISAKYLVFRESLAFFTPSKVKKVYTKGKYLWFRLKGSFYALGIHHGMEGSWCEEENNKHIILTFTFEDGYQIHFQDSRRFGTFKLYSSEKELQQYLQTTGPDVMKATPEEIQERFSLNKVQNKPLCEVLMDQSVLSGIGNYLRADIMYTAELSPHRTISSLNDDELNVLSRACISIPRKSYRQQATTCGNYESFIHSGGYTPIVYGRSSVKGNTVLYFQDKNKRTVWWVPKVQL